MSQTTYGYHLGGPILIVIFDLLDICSSQFDMITIGPQFNALTGVMACECPDEFTSPETRILVLPLSLIHI